MCSFEQDAGLGLAQQPRQRRLSAQEWEIAQILAIVLDQVEGVEDGRTRGLPSAQILKARQTVGAQPYRLAVDGEALGLDPLRRGPDCRQSRGPAISVAAIRAALWGRPDGRSSRSEEHTSELQ